MAKKKSYLRVRKAKNLRFLLAIIFILIFASVYYILSSRSINAEIEKINAEINSNNKKLEDINAEIVSLEEDYNIRNTDEFKEKIAQERLGMVKEADNGND